MEPGQPRRTQRERREATRARILEATFESLLERGYAATTVAEVQARAGVGRGTLLHYFPTRTSLLCASIEHLASTRVDRYAREVQLLPPSANRLTALVDLAWQDFNSPTFFAALELWVAARTDAELADALIPVERNVFKTLHEVALNVVDEAERGDPRIPTLVEFTIDLVTGLSMSAMLTSNLGRRESLLRRWKRALQVLLGELPAAELIEGRPAESRR
jgi:AcrR family transcriptional regulator